LLISNPWSDHPGGNSVADGIAANKPASVATGAAVVVVGAAVVVVGAAVVVVGAAVVVVGAAVVVVDSAGVPAAVSGPAVVDPQPARTNINAKVPSVVRIADASQVEVSFGDASRIRVRAPA